MNQIVALDYLYKVEWVESSDIITLFYCTDCVVLWWCLDGQHCSMCLYPVINTFYEFCCDLLIHIALRSCFIIGQGIEFSSSYRAGECFLCLVFLFRWIVNECGEFPLLVWAPLPRGWNSSPKVWRGSSRRLDSPFIRLENMRVHDVFSSSR